MVLGCGIEWANGRSCPAEANVRLSVVLAALLVLATVLVTGCGISKSDYYAAVKESSDLKAQLSKAQTDLTAARQELATATAERDLAQSKLNASQAGTSTGQADLAKVAADLAAAKQSLSTLSDAVKRHEAYVDIATAYFGFRAIADTAPQSDVVVAFGKIQTAVSMVTTDADLKAAWDAVWAASAANQDTDAQMTAFVKLLGQRLSETRPKTG